MRRAGALCDEMPSNCIAPQATRAARVFTHFNIQLIAATMFSGALLVFAALLCAFVTMADPWICSCRDCGYIRCAARRSGEDVSMVDPV